VGKLGAKGEVFEGVFVEDSMDDEAFRSFFKVDAVFTCTVAEESAVGAANRSGHRILEGPRLAEGWVIG
jgi:hypothetical protein